jgi:hypothetical protein
VEATSNQLDTVIMDNEDTVMKQSGITAFEENIVPKLLALSKTLARVGRLKSVEKQVSQLNLFELQKILADITQLSETAGIQTKELQALFEEFQVVAREVDEVEWTRIFTKEIQNFGHVVDGEYPAFRVFPVELKVDFAHNLVQINNRTVRVLHPGAVAGLVNQEVTRLNKERFNINLFMRAMVRAYDVLLAERQLIGLEKGNKNVAKSVPLRQIHSILSVRSGAAGYSQSQFAFDIYRLRTDSNLVFEGRRLVFESTRNASGSVVIPLPGGQKENIGSLEIVEVEGLEDGES